MLKPIAESSPELADFINTLNLPLSEPQHRHITQRFLGAGVGQIVAAPASVAQPYSYSLYK